MDWVDLAGRRTRILANPVTLVPHVAGGPALK
jgi:hypothetical protein